MDGNVQTGEAAQARPKRRIRVRQVMRSEEDIRRDAEAKAARAALKRRTADRMMEDGTVEPVQYSDEQYEKAFADAQATIEKQIETTRKRKGAMRYLSVFGMVAAIGITALYQFNGRFAQELYSKDYSHKIAEAFDNGDNFGVFDLNIDIRNLRDAHLKRLDETPDVVLLGASHWQEADVDLVTDRTMYNAHIHRDYYEDPLAMIEMLERHDRLPDTLILTIRDNQFTPVADRTDFLWLPGIPYYRKMAKQLGIEPHHPVEVAPVDTWRNRLNLDILYSNITRYVEADVKPGRTKVEKSKTLDVLKPGGSIVWSEKHDRLFTQERTRKETLEFAAYKIENPPIVDPKGVEHIETLLEYLNDKGVRVYLAHPPYNPLFWETVQGTAYMEGLKPVVDQVQAWADRFGWDVIGSFNGNDYGCTIEQYIDSEHANAECLSGIFNQFMALDRAKEGLPPLEGIEEAGPAIAAAPTPRERPEAALGVASAATQVAEAPLAAGGNPAELAVAANLREAEALSLMSGAALRGLLD